MPSLIVKQNDIDHFIAFTGEPLVSELLIREGFLQAHPCAGAGTCGKCAMEMQGALSQLTESERKRNSRLSCQTRLLGDAQVILPVNETGWVIESLPDLALKSYDPMPSKYGVAVDIGTTTLAMSLIDLKNPEILNCVGADNPQRAIAADVMGRIDEALKGQGTLQQQLINEKLLFLWEALREKSGLPASTLTHMVIVGNTTMLYLLMGHDPTSLARAPFEADRLFGETVTWQGHKAYLPQCISAFVGADVVCAVLASGMIDNNKTALLIDLGTNGEMVLWHKGCLTCGATAAGPVFEGAGIQMGCPSIHGAIDRVWVEHGSVKHHTIGNAVPIGICGSGLVDAIAAFLDIKAIDETGAVDDTLYLTPNVFISQGDIRAVQLAKGAIAAGIETLLLEHHIDANDVEAVYLAGGFGRHLNLQSAARIGMIPQAFEHKTTVIGNGALMGATSLLLNKGRMEKLREMQSCAKVINFAHHPAFTTRFVDEMLF